MLFGRQIPFNEHSPAHFPLGGGGGDGDGGGGGEGDGDGGDGGGGGGGGDSFTTPLVTSFFFVCWYVPSVRT